MSIQEQPDNAIARIRKIELNPLEVARTLRQLVEKHSFTQRELARRTGKKRSTIANFLRLLTLPDAVQHSVATGKVSMGHAKAILSIEGADRQDVLHREILCANLTVRQAEQRARELQSSIVSTPQVTDEDVHLRDLESRIQQKIGTRAELKGKGGKGQLTLHYYDLDDLDRILNSLGIQE